MSQDFMDPSDLAAALAVGSSAKHGLRLPRGGTEVPGGAGTWGFCHFSWGSYEENSGDVMSFSMFLFPSMFKFKHFKHL